MVFFILFYGDRDLSGPGFQKAINCADGLSVLICIHPEEGQHKKLGRAKAILIPTFTMGYVFPQTETHSLKVQH